MDCKQNNIVLLGECKMAKKKLERGQVKTIDMVKEKCIECKAEYEGTKTTYENGDIVVSPMRCVPCQTKHLTNLRVNKTIKDFQLLGNLKTRLSDVQREAIVNVIGNQLQVLLDRYSGSTIKASAFDLGKVKG